MGGILDAAWTDRPPGLRVYERTEPIARDGAWSDLVERLLTWGVKTASGFRVESGGPVRPGQRLIIRASVLGIVVAEPVEVCDVVIEDDRAAFAYRTLPGHPVRGEEAFILTRSDDGILLTLRSLTGRSDRAGWRMVHPLLRVAQTIVRRRYFRALR